MGAAVAFQASERGASVIGIDRYDPPHSLGSTHAETRISRLAVGEGSHYLPFVERSHEIWRELEARTGAQLLHLCGGYIFTEQEPVPGQRWEDFVTETAAIAAAAPSGPIPFEVLDPTTVRADHPWIKIPDHNKAGLEPTAGLVMAERCVEVQLRLAEANGAVIRRNEEVVSVDPDDGGVTITTTAGQVRADRVVVATGPWFSDLAHPSHAEQVVVTRQVVYWFEADDLDAFSTERIPYIMWIGARDEDYFAVFPTPPGGTPAVKVLGEQFLETTDPSTVDRHVSRAEIEAFHRDFVAPKVDGISDRCVKASVCLYTNTADDHFLIDTDPRSDRILAMSPCSGHGFKHSAALGETVVQVLFDGVSERSLEPFRSRV